MNFKKAVSLLVLVLYMVFTVSCAISRAVEPMTELHSKNPPDKITAVCDSSGKWFLCPKGHYASVTPQGISVPVIVETDSDNPENIQSITLPLDKVKWIEYQESKKLKLIGVIGILIGGALLYGYISGKNTQE